MFTILAALNDEIRLIRSEMEIDAAIHLKQFSIFTGKYRNSKLSLVRTGVGKNGIASAMSYCIEELRPTLLMNIGYAGGLSPQLHAGDLVIANSVIDESTEKCWVCDGALVNKAKSISERAELRHQIGKMVTVDAPITEPHQKAFLGTRFEAIACEMESSIFTDAATAAKIPFLVVRSILDPLDTVLPDIPENAIIGGKISIFNLLDHLKSRPRDLLKLPKFSYLASQARISLTNFVKEWVDDEQRI